MVSYTCQGKSNTIATLIAAVVASRRKCERLTADSYRGNRLGDGRLFFVEFVLVPICEMEDASEVVVNWCPGDVLK